MGSHCKAALAAPTTTQFYYSRAMNDGKSQPPPYNNVAGTGPPVQNVVVQNVDFGSRPVTMVCPRCNNQITTNTSAVTSTAQHIGCCLCCIFGGVFGCCLIPYCMDSLQQVTHTCPLCKSTLGIYKGGF